MIVSGTPTLGKSETLTRFVPFTIKVSVQQWQSMNDSPVMMIVMAAVVVLIFHPAIEAMLKVIGINEFVIGPVPQKKT